MKLKSFRTRAALILAALMLVIATAIASPAQTFKTLVNFDMPEGSGPLLVSLVQGTGGNLYGTTEGGGANNDGTVFKITPSGTLTVLYSFCPQSGCSDGYFPIAGLVQATDGNFYGTTLESGNAPPPCQPSCGTVFKITLDGKLTTLYTFCTQAYCTDGDAPFGALVQGTDGDLYGTTNTGGDFTCLIDGNAVGCGTVFKITPGGTLTTLHIFEGADGIGPYGALIQATDGNFYGTTLIGGASGNGTVFKITPSGSLTTLHSFEGTDGYIPSGALIQAADGNFYGTTMNGGANGYGTVFKITPSGTLTTLHSFVWTDGYGPSGTLIQATDGNFYGITQEGGSSSNCPYSDWGCGTIFKITPGGTLTTLHSFCTRTNCPDGFWPEGGLVQATNGNFYGTTPNGGGDNSGTVFILSMGLGPFVETQTTSGKVGATVKILGTNLTGATSVSFNGTPAAFAVLSKSLIRTTVPAGATTGFVTVTTPSGVLTSNQKFRVGP
jgi:uncharacterized repeat protein (TIGR03803 family)